MPQKQKQRPSPIEDPPTASSSESEEDEDQQPSSQQHVAQQQGVSSEEDEEASSEEEPSPLPLASTNPPSNPHPKPSSSDSESETDSELTKSKPKPTDQAQKPKPQPQPRPKSTPKRPVQSSAHVTDAKRAKKKQPTDASSSAAASDDEMEEDGKKSGGQTKSFQRVFSEEDVVVILKGVAEFISKTGQDPYKYPEAFHSFVKKSLHVEASSNQLKEKIRRLKKKFETKAVRGEKGEDPKFSKSHDQTVFELSKKVWGEGANGLVEKPKPNGKRKPAKTLKNVAKPETILGMVELEEPGKPNSGDANVNSLYREISAFKELDEDELKRGLALIEESKRKELEGKWKKLRLAEIELVANRSLLIGEEVKLIFEALQSSNH